MAKWNQIVVGRLEVKGSMMSPTNLYIHCLDVLKNGEAIRAVKVPLKTRLNEGKGDNWEW